MSNPVLDKLIADNELADFEHYRDLLGLTQDDIAAMLGYSSYRSYITTTAREIRQRTFVRIVRFVLTWTADRTTHMNAQEKKQWVDSLVRSSSRKRTKLSRTAKQPSRSRKRG